MIYYVFVMFSNIKQFILFLKKIHPAQPTSDTIGSLNKPDALLNQTFLFDNSFSNDFLYNIFLHNI